MCPVGLWKGVASHDDPCPPQTQILTKLQVSAIGELGQCLYCHNYCLYQGMWFWLYCAFQKTEGIYNFVALLNYFLAFQPSTEEC